MAETIPGSERSDPLRRALRTIRKRELSSRVLRALTFGLLAGLSALAAYLLADRLVGLGGREWIALGAALGVSLAAAAARGASLLRFSLFDAALLADDRLRLKERVSSALYVAADPDPLRDPAWGELIRRDGVRSLERADLRRGFPVRLPRAARWVLVPAALSILLAFVPPVDLLGLQRSRLAEGAMKREVDRKKDELAKRLEELRKEAKKPLDPEVEKALEALKKRAPEEPEPRKKDDLPVPGEEAQRKALVEFTRLEEALKKSLDAERFGSLKEFLDRFPPGTMARSPLTGSIRDAMKEGDFGKALSEMKKLQDLLKALSEKKREGKLSEEELSRMKKLAEELARLSKDSALLSKLSSKLGAASSSLSSGNPGDALESLKALEDELSSLDRLAEDLKFLEDALELAQLSQDELSSLHKCPNCGKVSKDPGGT